MLNFFRRLISPAFRESERSWKVYHESERACRVIARQGHAGFVLVLRNRLNDVLAAYPMSDSVRESAERFHEAMNEAEKAFKKNTGPTSNETAQTN